MVKTKLMGSTSFLVCDFFRNLHRDREIPKGADKTAYYQNLLKKRHFLHRLKVFLCGKEVGKEAIDRHFDKRHQIKKFLNVRMGCDAFLGEDIKDIKKLPTIDADALTIEVSEAEASDLIFLFLESFGTTAELTAFVLSKGIADKLVVFNDIEHKDAKNPSFLTIGPLRLLEVRNPGSVIFYDPKQLTDGLSAEVIAHLDRAVSKSWFKKSIDFRRLSSFWSFETFVTLAVIYAFYPISTEELAMVLAYRLTDKELEGALAMLKRDKHIKRSRKNVLEPSKPVELLGINRDFQVDIARCRSLRLYDRLDRLDVESNYRLLF